MLQIVLVLTTERILGAIEGWTSHEGVAKVDVSGMRPALLYMASRILYGIIMTASTKDVIGAIE